MTRWPSSWARRQRLDDLRRRCRAEPRIRGHGRPRRGDDHHPSHDQRAAGPRRWRAEQQRQAKTRHPSLTCIMGDQLYGGPIVARAMADISSDWHFQRVRRPKDQPRFTPIPRRWVVERTFAWISRKRRLARDYERTTRSSLAFAILAMTRLMLHRLTKPSHA